MGKQVNNISVHVNGPLGSPCIGCVFAIVGVVFDLVASTV